MHDNDDYEIGYGKPPKDSQWTKGQSGNPKGRPRTVKDVRVLFDKVLSRMVPVTERGIRRMVPIREAIVLQVATRAASGDYRFLKMAVGFMLSNQVPEEFTVDPSDLKAFERMVKRIRDAEGESDV